MLRLRRFGQSFCLLVILGIALAGCAQVNRHVRIAYNGAGEYLQTLTFEKAVYDNAPDIAKQSLADYATYVDHHGGTASHTSDSGHVTWTFDWPFTSLDQLNKNFSVQPSYSATTGVPQVNDQLNITSERTLLNTTFHAQGSLNFPTAASNLLPAGALTSARESVTLEFPTAIISAPGGTIDGNTVTYSTSYYAQAATIDATASGVNWASVTPLLLGVLLLGFLAFYGLVQLFSGEA